MTRDEYNRRQFLRTTLLGGAGAMLTASSILRAEDGPIRNTESEKKIITRKLGKTGLELPAVGFGVMRADNPELVRQAIKDGIVLFDTAHGYQRGKNEEMLGDILKDRPRDSFVLETKVPPEETDRSTGELGPASTSKAFLDRLDVSLKRLKLDYVDILYVHGLSRKEAVLYPAMLEAATKARQSGKAKHVGVSTHKNEPEVIKAAIESGVYEVVLTSVNFMQDHYDKVTEAIAEAAKAGLGIVAMKTMAGGFHDKERTKPINCRAALKFVLQDKNITTAIPGNTSFEHLAMNASVNYDLTLTAGERADLLGNRPQGSLYCNGCEHCVAGCPKKLPIPDAMRAYMYAYGYNDHEMARSLISELEMPKDACGDCKQCTAVCSQGFNIADRLNDVSRLTDVQAVTLS
jgi:predicted aldo/keto reductase-like oxidoreductase